MCHSTFSRVPEVFYRIRTLREVCEYSLIWVSGSEALWWIYGFRAFHRAKMSRPYGTSLQLDTYISFSENVCCAHISYLIMLLSNGVVGYADNIKKLFLMHFYTNCTLN